MDIFLNKQPKNSLVVRLILPLVDLITSTSPDERQLADKTTGILRSRLGKAKDIPSGIDEEQTVGIIKELHARARKASSSDVLSTLSQCSLFLSRTLLHAGAGEGVMEVYKESLVDFVTRKASRLNTGFLQDFVRRHPDTAWAMRDIFLSITGKAVNAYRQCQAFLLIHTLISQLQVVGSRRLFLSS